MHTPPRYWPALTALVTALLVGCAGHWHTSYPISDGNFVPDVRLNAADRDKYQMDVVTCQKAVIDKYGAKPTSNNAISDMRRCLIDKGYVLLS